MSNDDEFNIPDEDIPEDVDDISDLEDIDGVEVEREYWTDYTLQHHGIIFCWRNNLKQVLLAVEESIAGENHSENYDVVLLSASGDYITQLETVENEEDALREALNLQQKYPQGNFPELEEESENPDGFVPLTESGAEKTKSEREDGDELLEEFGEEDNEESLLSKIRSIFS